MKHDWNETARGLAVELAERAQRFITSGRYDDPVQGAMVLHFPLPLSAEGVRVSDDWDTHGMRGTGSHCRASGGLGSLSTHFPAASPWDSSRFRPADARSMQRAEGFGRSWSQRASRPRRGSSDESARGRGHARSRSGGPKTRRFPDRGSATCVRPARCAPSP